jgi:AmmeMemoRadiSam system protein A
MQPSPSIELDVGQQAQLLDIARRSIEQGFATREPLQVPLDDLQPELCEPAAVFITLTRTGELRGCVGSLEARAALAQAVADSAFNSAFLDRRFPPLRADELPGIRIEISVLSPLQDLPAESREDLLNSLRPGIDGLVIEDLGRRSTFLPKVWESLPTPAEFVEHLMLKAGLAAGHWSRDIRVQRYVTLCFGDN